ncbi:prolipoprotein diacylglyceryl transferase [Tuanshanicoccus lijuaniae]|uniref:prolipoprotein diacylglyceryl transferase n=1 Tax=Aerococcaceae bacterium zg-1292 TaxID=2774330 RepID=UPI001934FDE8|nr:prolipoprotein diacylglyceryl transferase [Aerococcaceae bacterium zg-1292]MBS4456784.1 prolipoprotein diacylglyceryl transferase [Aerococcaceae bacterium zg-A91]MBS4458576.1 prolipoprotein diacylglyceryl transferase [Aerococcaceae bacterium zg-BR33]QQA36695.1 prolipoprotein diacylglyceryl transferase [Aerococcaceae bacterium zg-1292]
MLLYGLAKLSPIAFRLFGWPVHWYGIIIGIGIVIAYTMIQREAKRKELDEEQMSDIVFWTIIIGFIGARLYYVLFRLDYYLMHPTQILSIWQGGIAIYGGILAGLVTLYYLAKRYHLSFITILDVVAPAVLTAQSIGRWGNFMNQEAYGYEVSRDFLEKIHLPKVIIEQMNIEGVYHHPTFLYESLWSALGVILLLWLRQKPNLLKEGEVAAGYLLWYGLGRMVIEGMRTDSLYLGPLRISQWVAVVFVISSIGFIMKRRNEATIMYYTANRH